MKKTMLFLASILTISLFAENTLPDLDWKIQNGEMANWSGRVEALQDGGMLLKGKNMISYCKRKYPVGDKRNVRIVYSIQGISPRIGIYCYAANGQLLGQFQERVPNAETVQTFEAVFKLPEKIQDIEVKSFRVFFQAPFETKIFKVEMFLENGELKNAADKL